jgi:hypothetical protein
MGTDLAPLTKADLSQLARHEKTIEQGVGAFIAVGIALAAIREGKLYRANHKTFADYCKARWDFDRQRAYQLIQAAKVGENVKNSGQSPPRRAAVAEELVSLPAEDQAEALQEAREEADGEPTAAEVRRVVQRRQNPDAEEDYGDTRDDPPAPSLAQAMEDFILAWRKKYHTPACIVRSVLENLTNIYAEMCD